MTVSKIAYHQGVEWAANLTDDQRVRRDEMDTDEKEGLLSVSTQFIGDAVYQALTGNTDDGGDNFFSPSLTYQGPEKDYFLRGVLDLY